MTTTTTLALAVFFVELAVLLHQRVSMYIEETLLISIKVIINTRYNTSNSLIEKYTSSVSKHTLPSTIKHTLMQLCCKIYTVYCILRTVVLYSEYFVA